MASSSLTGERRWASTRKSGMTVLGKVPKPINLPSQRLENHGLDPNVEIVPKGTLTWGSRPSAAPNAWSSSTLLSPKTDGSAGSPSYASGRLSSGGSGTRPSTAGSDRSLDLASSSWGPNSRPSSASGILSSNQASINESRPRSAETRPGSSHLSRFAEHSVEGGTVAWGSTKTAEKLGTASSKGNAFTLSSGDFPTLGSEKNSETHSQRGHSSQGRPASACSSDATPKERLEPPLSGGGNVDVCVDHGNADALKTDKYSYVGGGAPPNTSWQRESQPAQLQPVLMKPHQLDSWNGPPIRSPEGGWYRGGATGGPYRPVGPLGSFPIEPFAYYPPQFPPHSEGVPRAGAGPIKPGESYHPHMPPNSFMVPSHPVIPARPGVYQTSMPYDGYYGPQASFCNSGEREAPFVGAPSQPGIYNRFPNQNGSLNLGHLQTRPGACDPVMAKEQKESDRAQGTHQVQYKVLLKQHDGWEDNGAKGEAELSAISNPPHIDRRTKSGGTSHEEDWQTNSRKNEPTKFAKPAPDQQAIIQTTSDHQGNSTGAVIMNSEETSNRTTGGILMKKPETAILTACYQQQYPVIKKNAALIEKIEGLNNKVRSSDIHGDVGPFPRTEEKRKSSKVVSTKLDHSTKVVHSNDVTAENAPASGTVIPVSPEVDASIVDNNPKSYSGGKVVSCLAKSQVIAVSKPESSRVGEIAQSQVHNRANTTRSRVDHHAKSRPSNQVDDGWTKESQNRDSSVMAPVKNDGVGPPDCHPCEEATVKHEAHHAAIIESYSSPLDSDEYRAQRAKMKEIATYRAKQLQKEEEERTREQKAKALAKLEELNKRSSAQVLRQKSNDVSPPTEAMQQKPDSGSETALGTNENIVEEPVGVSAGKSDALVQPNKNVLENPEPSVDLPLSMPSHIASTVTQGSATSHDQSLSLQHDINAPEAILHKSASHSHDSSVSKHKQMGYKRRNSMSQEKNLGDKPVTGGNMESPKNLAEVTELASSCDAMPHNEESSVQHKKKNYRNPRNKNRLDEAPVSSTAPSLAHTKEIFEKGLSENGQTLHPASLVGTVSVAAQSSADAVVNQGSTDASFTHGLSKPTEEAHGRVGHQWKPPPHRRSPRNQTGPRTGDKFHSSEAVIWAPVGSNKNEQSEEASPNVARETSHPSSGKNEHDMHNGMKTKRAEMERYVPKPVAKELSQQENSRQPSPSIRQAASGDLSGTPDFGSNILDRSRHDGSAAGKTEAFVADTKTGEDSKPNRRGRMHVSWRQRNSTESPSILQSFNEGHVSFDRANLVQIPSDQHQQSNPDSLPKKHMKLDGWNSNNNVLVPPESVTSHAVVKDQPVTSRQRRQQLKVQRGGISNYAPPDNKDFQSGKDEKSHVQSTVVDINESDVSNAPRSEIKNSGEHMRSHWKPKSQAYAHNQKQVNRSNGGQRVASHGGRSDKEFSSQGLEDNPPYDGNINAPTKNTGDSETTNECLQEAKGETKVDVHPTKEQVCAANQRSPNNVDPLLENVNGQHEKRVSQAPRRHGQHNGRFNRGRDTFHRGRDFGPDAGKQNHFVNGDRQKNSSHFEYQPVGSYNKPPSDSSPNSNVGEEKKNLQSPGPRFRERGQYQPRRGGHYFGRASDASVCVGDSCNGEE